MPNYIEFNDDDEPKHETLKNDGRYIEPMEKPSTQTQLPSEDDGESKPNEKNETESDDGDKPKAIANLFVINRGRLKQPKTVVFVAVVIGFIAVFVLAKFWTREAELARFIVSGNRINKTEDIEKLISKFVGKKMNDISLAEIADTLSTMAYIRKVIATKEFPDAIRLRIQEREPIATAIIGGKLKMLDESGYILNKSEHILESTRLPILTGFEKISQDSTTGLMMLDSLETASALALCKALPKNRCAKLVVSEVNMSEPNKTIVMTAGANTKFLFAKGDEAENLNKFETFWKHVVVKKGVKAFEYVDVRFDGKIFAKEHETINTKRKSQN